MRHRPLFIITATIFVLGSAAGACSTTDDAAPDVLTDVGCSLRLDLGAYVVTCPADARTSPACKPPAAIAAQFDAGIPLGCNVSGGGCSCPCIQFTQLDDAAQIICPL